MAILQSFKVIYTTLIVNLLFSYHIVDLKLSYPMVINTWAFTSATDKAWQNLLANKTALDAIENGCTVCEVEQCDGTVGYGGSPDEHGETTLDAMIMDGKTMDVGCVGNLRRIKNAISVARKILHHTKHSMLSGNQATQFAKIMGYHEEPLSTKDSEKLWLKWRENNCQPNFWKNVYPNPETTCGPYKPQSNNRKENRRNHFFGQKNHDTIGMVAIDVNMDVAAGTSTNGAKYKIPGRVGDSPIPGAGAYADNDVGGAAATGDGDLMLRFLPSFLAVEEMRRGVSPAIAAAVAISRVARKYPSFVGGIVTVNIKGEYSAACHGMDSFPYTVTNKQLGHSVVESVPCLNEFNDVL